ncbi:MAG: BREX-3 system phosphatase PglZ [Chloroflexota bacterium]
MVATAKDMLERILSRFPRQVHALTLAEDPDGVLAEEKILKELGVRGIRVIAEQDPMRLRCRVEQARPWTPERPLVVVTPEPLNRLPYDLWQQGQHVVLALHESYPNLAYPVIRTLTPAQRWRLTTAPQPDRRLSRQDTVEHVLRHVFGVNFDSLREPAGLVAWLNTYHQQAEPMPAPLAESLLARLRAFPVYAGWPLTDLLASRDAFAAFVQDQWVAYVQKRAGQLIADGHVPYVLRFADDQQLQDTLPGLLRTGALAPLEVGEPSRLPAWAQSGVIASAEDRRPRRIAELMADLHGRLTAMAAPRWEDWQWVGRAWSELSVLCQMPDAQLAPEQESEWRDLAGTLDRLFLSWLQMSYSQLAGLRLPTPHHVHHVPEYLAYRHPPAGGQRVALLILDGLSLADWRLLGERWRAGHSEWRYQEMLLLAQVPTITAISRQALISGLRPTDFAASIDHNRAEPREWAAFWGQKGIPPAASPYVRLSDQAGGLPSVVGDPAARYACLVDSGVDDIVHGSSQGGPGVQAGLRVWLDRDARRLAAVIDGFLDDGFAVYLASDHGHVEARGMGRPSEGLMVQTRGQRARIYRDPHTASHWQQAFAETVVWSQDGLLPDDLWAVMPEGRHAFVPAGETVVTHGGLTLDEVVVPFVGITRG